MNVSKFILKYHWPYNRGRYLTSHIETNAFKIFNTKYPCLLQYKLGLHRPIHSIIIIKDVSKCFIRSYGHFANFKNEKRSNNKHTNFTNQILHWSTMSVILAAGIYFGLLFKKIVAIPSSFTLYAASPIFKEKIEEKGTTEYQKNVSNQLSGSRFKYNFIADVVDKVSDGVVFIEIKDHRRKDMSGQNLSMSNGSGFIVDPDGLILTNAHVVANKPRASTIKVRLSDGREFVGKIEDFDAISDLALVRIQCTGLNPLIMGSSKDVRPGEFVVALGSPLSLANTITSGVVSSIGRASKDLGLQGKDIQYIQTDAAITFGNSGGPLVNLDGEVIAINSMKVTSGISFAIPIDYAKEFLEKIKKKKTFMSKFKKDDSQEESISRRRYLGITMLSLSTEVISQMLQRGPGNIIPSNVTHGILIWRIVVGSPAYHAGLEPGDIVTHINGHEIHSSRDVYKLLESKSDLRLVINRKGERYNVSVTPEE